MAKANQLEDLLQQVEDLSAALAAPDEPEIEELLDTAEQNVGDADIRDPDVRDLDIGEAPIGDAVLGDAEIGDPVLSDAEIADAVLSDTVIGDAIADAKGRNFQGMGQPQF